MEDKNQDGVFKKSEENCYSKSNFNSNRITVIGDPDVGKTCLLYTYTTNTFPREYMPTVFDNCSGEILVNKIEHNVYLWDTAGQEEYERLRTLSYPETDCFLLCFSIDDRDSFENTVSKWYPEVKRYCPKAVILLIGTKNDLRKCKTNCVTQKEATKMRKRIGAVKYLECSALENEGLSTVFVEAVRNCVKKSSNTLCTIF